METFSKKDFYKIFFRFISMLSQTTLILILYHYGIAAKLLPNSVQNLNITVIVLFVIGNSFLSFLVVGRVIKPVQIHLSNPNNLEIKQQAYRNLCNLPNSCLIILPVIICFIFIMASMSYLSFYEQMHIVVLELSFFSTLFAIMYLYINNRITANLQFFEYQKGLVNISMQKRIGGALIFGILGVITNSVFTFYFTKDSVESIGSIVVIYILCILIPFVIILIKMNLNSTIGPINRILKAWDEMEHQGSVNLPNMCLGEMADLTSRFHDAMQNTQNQLQENMEISKELSKVAIDLSTNAESVSSNCENIASSQQFIAKSTTQESNIISKIQEIINQVAAGIVNVQEKVKNIDNVSETITSIANQTNILSLNAAIEAARAGEAGRGFNVVADQVRKLSDESKKAVGNTYHMVKEIQDVANQQRVLINDLLSEISILTRIAEETSASTEEVSAASEEQSASMQEISESATLIANMASKLMKTKFVDLEPNIGTSIKSITHLSIKTSDKKLTHVYSDIVPSMVSKEIEKT